MSNRTCDETLTAVYLYLDQEMNRYRRWRITRHLRTCPPCIGIYEFEERLRVQVRDKCREEMPTDLLERLRTALRQEPNDR